MCNILLLALWFTIFFSELLNTCSTFHVLLFITIQDQCIVVGCFIFLSCMHLTFNKTSHGFFSKTCSMLFLRLISNERSAYLLTLASSNHHNNSVQILLATIIYALVFQWVISNARLAYLLTLASSIHHYNNLQNLLGTIICAFYFTLPQSAFWALPKKIDHWQNVCVFFVEVNLTVDRTKSASSLVKYGYSKGKLVIDSG